MVSEATSTESEMGLVLVKMAVRLFRKEEPVFRESFSSWPPLYVHVSKESAEEEMGGIRLGRRALASTPFYPQQR